MVVHAERPEAIPVRATRTRGRVPSALAARGLQLLGAAAGASLPRARLALRAAMRSMTLAAGADAVG